MRCVLSYSVLRRAVCWVITDLWWVGVEDEEEEEDDEQLVEARKAILQRLESVVEEGDKPLTEILEQKRSVVAV